MIDPYAGRDLVRYLGSQHSAVGLLLVWIGMPALVGGMIFAASIDQIPRSLSASVAAWGLIAIPLGFSMRRRAPSAPILSVASLLLGVALGVLLFIEIVRESYG